MKDKIHVISLGAGVQSSTMALMASRGELTPMPVAAIFADTQDEPQSVYKWLNWLEPQLKFPVYRVTRGRLSDRELIVRRSKKSGKLYRKSGIPAYTMSASGKAGMLPRKCTLDHKIQPIIRKCRELAGIKRSGKEVLVISWIGISTDEASRMKPSKWGFIENRWPLIEAGISRKDCLSYFEKLGLPKPPRSACVFCPYHNDREWLRLKTEEPEAFAAAVAFEGRLQEATSRDEVSNSTPWLHRSCKPLGEVNLEPDHSSNLFQNECDGMCGV